MKTKAEIEAVLEEQIACLKERETAYLTAERALRRQAKVVGALKRKLRDYPHHLYWSNVTVQPWPMEIVRLITDYCGIAEKLYTEGRHACRLLIQPRTLAALHIKHALMSQSVVKYKPWVIQWLKINRATLSDERPRWKTCEVADSLEDMARRFRTRTFKVGKMVLTLLGPHGIIAFDVADEGTPSQEMLRKVRSLAHLVWGLAPLKAVPGRIIVPYHPVPNHVRVLYGGRRTNRRLVKALML